MGTELTDQEYERIRAAIESWGNTAELAAFAEKGHGYGNSDSGFGVVYPDDLDEYDRVVEKIAIPEGAVRIYGYWGPPDGYEFIVSLRNYMEVLSHVLRANGLDEEALVVQRMMSGCGA